MRETFQQYAGFPSKYALPKWLYVSSNSLPRLPIFYCPRETNPLAPVVSALCIFPAADTERPDA
jgi:hypothetical protein